MASVPHWLMEAATVMVFFTLLFALLPVLVALPHAVPVSSKAMQAAAAVMVFCRRVNGSPCCAGCFVVQLRLVCGCGVR